MSVSWTHGVPFPRSMNKTHCLTTMSCHSNQELAGTPASLSSSVLCPAAGCKMMGLTKPAAATQYLGEAGTE
jgi:hypothetical protein